MTGLQFRQTHGDPAGWTDTEYEAYFAWTATTPTLRQRIARRIRRALHLAA
ncbi:hypothetical protein [Streptomyces sp. NPDC046862]|uniref:hypothetical protein n=1 Tax=Streptomyces sp. NPDC046862 TaxID=3154603 RepID=UPI003451E9A5